jgi:hypothetical protein
MTIKELSDDNRALTKQVDALNEIIGKAHDEKMLYIIREAKLKKEIKRLNDLLNQKQDRDE